MVELVLFGVYNHVIKPESIIEFIRDYEPSVLFTELSPDCADEINDLDKIKSDFFWIKDELTMIINQGGRVVPVNPVKEQRTFEELLIHYNTPPTNDYLIRMEVAEAGLIAKEINEGYNDKYFFLMGGSHLPLNHHQQTTVLIEELTKLVNKPLIIRLNNLLGTEEDCLNKVKNHAESIDKRVRTYLSVL